MSVSVSISENKEVQMVHIACIASDGSHRTEQHKTKQKYLWLLTADDMTFKTYFI